MKIIKPGKPHLVKKTKRFECKACGCIFAADKDEYHCGSQYNEVFWTCDCPTCGEEAYTEDKGYYEDTSVAYRGAQDEHR